MTFVAERQLIADACRVVAARGLSDGFLGHISMRVDHERLLVRCRGPQERGLAWTTAAPAVMPLPRQPAPVQTRRNRSAT